MENKKKKNSYFRSKEGGLTMAVIVTFVGFIMTLLGLRADIPGVYGTGFVLMVASMLYSPVRTYIIRK